MFLTTLLLAVSLVVQEDVQIKAHKITDNIYMLQGQGGNIGVSFGEDGVFMIDDQFAPLSDKIKAAIAELTDKPVKFLANTHYHGDHTGGNENFGKSAAIIVAHENVRKRLAAGSFMKDFNSKVPPMPKEGLPVVTFTRDVSFHMNGEEIAVFHVRNAHTDGDAIIHFKKSGVVHMGDTFFNGMYPYIDAHAGGGIDGMIRVADMILRLGGDDLKIIPGHGPIATKEDLKAFRNMLATVRGKMRPMIAAHKTLEEVQAAKPTADFDETWGKGFLKADRWVSLIYNDLNSKHGHGHGHGH